MAKGHQYLTRITFGGKVANSLKAAFKYNQQQTRKTGKDYEKLQQVTQKAMKVGGAITAAAFTIATKAAVDFQDQMADIATLLDGDVDSKVNVLSNDVKRLAIMTGKSTKIMSSGLYEVVSAYGDTANNAKYLEIASKAAVAGNAEVTDSVKLLSAVTKGYGDTSLEANKKVADLAFKTVKLGQTSYPELAANMGKTVAIANTLKLSQEELFGATATLTGVTGNTAEVTTQLRATMQGFLQPTTNMSKALKALGYENGQVAMESEGLGNILMKLKKLVNDDEVAFSNLFGSVEAKNAVLALAGEQADVFASKTQEMVNSVGAADAAFKRKSMSAKVALGRIVQMGTVLAINLGDKVLPKIIELSEKMQVAFVDHKPQIDAFVDKVGKGLDKAFTIGAKAADIAFKILKGGYRFFVTDWPKIEPVVYGVVAGLAAYKAMTTAAAIKTKLLALHTAYMSGTLALTPFGAIALAISAVVVAGVALYRNWDKVTAAAQKLGEKLTAVWGGVKKGFVTTFDFMKGMFKGYINGYIRGFNWLIGGMNKIQFKAPDWVPKIGGKEFGINIPTIPMFAKGGIATRPSIFGEAGPEMAIPLRKGSARSISLLEKTARLLGVRPQEQMGTGLSILNRIAPKPLKVLGNAQGVQKERQGDVKIEIHIHGADISDSQQLEPALKKIKSTVLSAVEQAGLNRRRVSLGTANV